MRKLVSMLSDGTTLRQADPEKYIAYVLTQLGKTGQEDIGRLLPWSERGKAIEIRGTEEGRG